jgi:Family of unknown function (DUF5681)
MPANTGENQGGRFSKGSSGNPRGKPKGARHRITLAAEALLEGEAQTLTRKAIELALAGDTVALRLCLERILPPRRQRPINFRLPPLRSPADAVSAMAIITGGVASGEITTSEATELSSLVEGYVRALEAADFEARLRVVEERRNATGV